jgi:hypothetical protein
MSYSKITLPPYVPCLLAQYKDDMEESVHLYVMVKIPSGQDLRWTEPAVPTNGGGSIGRKNLHYKATIVDKDDEPNERVVTYKFTIVPKDEWKDPDSGGHRRLYFHVDILEDVRVSTESGVETRTAKKRCGVAMVPSYT